jgi:hypothetical protein
MLTVAVVGAMRRCTTALIFERFWQHCKGSIVYPRTGRRTVVGKTYKLPVVVSGAGRADAYVDRKRREVALIAECLASPPEIVPVSSVASAIETKFKLAGVLRAERSLQSWAITETARPETQRWRSGAYRFSFGYQRADLHVEGPPIYDAIDAAGARVRQRTVYTGSGMSAIAVVVAALVRVHGNVEVHAARGCYGETRELLDSLRRQVTIEALTARRATASPARNTFRVLLIDSAVSRGFADYRKPSTSDIDAVLFDTTCFWQRSSRIRLVVAWALRAKLPVVLVRSHAKLDSLGIEYGRLGSIVFAWRASDESSRGLPTLIRATEDSVRLYGVAAIPAHFPPFTGTDDYRKCSAARTAAIIRSTRRMARGLSARLGGKRTVRVFQHALYLALAPGKEMALGDVKRAAGALCDALGKQGLPVKHAGSFGFDFVAVEWFFDAILRRNVIRIAGADLPAGVIDTIVDAIVTWWSQHRMSAQPKLPAAVVTTARTATL